MAYTKIHAVKATVDKAIDYICNPEKTDDKIFISSYACSPETAALDFKYTLDHCRENSPNKAYHLIQAFAPGEVSFEEAHIIGQELADRVLEGKYSYVITTHIDKGHVHNHVLFCAADNIEHNKYHDCKKTYYRIRHLSDELCKEHNLSIISPAGQRGKNYMEWQANMVTLPKHNCEGISITPLNRLPLMMIFFCSCGQKDMKSKAKPLEKMQENIFLFVLSLKINLCVAVSGRWEKNIQKNESKIELNRSGNAKLPFPKKIMLPES